jgi:DNA-binding SARP family transcriptional activator
MSNLRISLFGKLQIQEGNGQNIELEPHRAQELFCYLLLYHDHLHDREKLATLLWPDSPSAQSKRYLRQTLWQLQSGLNHTAPNHKSDRTTHLLCVEHTHIGMNPATDYWLDIAVFEQAFAAVEDKQGRELCDQQAERLRQAVQLYQGDLLEGWYQDWCIYERERYQNIYLAMLDKLLDYSEAQQRYEAGVAYGEQILRYDQAREQTHRQLMHLHYQAGNRTAAIHQYEACVAALQRELDVGPARRTVALYRQICHEPMGDPLLPFSSNHAEASIPEDPERDPLQQLEHIQLTLAQLQAQVALLVQELAQQKIR